MTTSISNGITKITQYPVEFIMCKTGGLEGEKTFQHLKEHLPKFLKLITTLFYTTLSGALLASLYIRPIQAALLFSTCISLHAFISVITVAKLCEAYRKTLVTV